MRLGLQGSHAVFATGHACPDKAGNTFLANAVFVGRECQSPTEEQEDLHIR